MTVRDELIRLIALNYDEKWVPNHIAFQQIKNYGHGLITGLTACLSDSDPEVRMLAVELLHESRSEVAISALVTALADADREVRIAVADTLGSFGPLAVEALSQLGRIFHEQHGYAKMVVTVAILRIDPARRSELLPLIQQALVDDDITVRWAAEEYYAEL